MLELARIRHQMPEAYVSYAPLVNDQDRISADDAVRIYKVGKSTLFGWMREGKISRYKKRGDRRTFVSRAELDRFLEFRIVNE